jgi:hypothetical protein
MSTNCEAPYYLVFSSLVITSVTFYSLYLKIDNINSNRFMVISYGDQYLDTLNFSISSMATNVRYNFFDLTIISGDYFQLNSDIFVRTRCRHIC